MSARQVRRKSATRLKKPRILIVTPEITYLPEGMGNLAGQMSAKAGGMADVSASLVAALFDLGADVHVALPHYRRMFHEETAQLVAEELRVYKSRMPNERIHLAEDRCFYYRDHVYSKGDGNAKLSLAFQREVINNIINTVQPDLIHCNDWMTGLVPAAARREGIPCLFTVHNIHTHKMTLAQVEDMGIDAAEFWGNLYYSRPPYNYEESRGSNPIDLQASGIFGAHYINTVSPTFLQEIVNGWHSFIPDSIRSEIRNKYHAGCAVGILNAPDPTDNPAIDDKIPFRYGPENHAAMKRRTPMRRSSSGRHASTRSRKALSSSRTSPTGFSTSTGKTAPSSRSSRMARISSRFGISVRFTESAIVLACMPLMPSSRSSASRVRISWSCRRSLNRAACRRCRRRSMVRSPLRTTRAVFTIPWRCLMLNIIRVTDSFSTPTTPTDSSGRWIARWISGGCRRISARVRCGASCPSRSTASTMRHARSSISSCTRRC